MENIANITLGQIGTWLNHHWIQIMVWLIAADNILITAFTAAGWDTTFLQRVSKFLGSILLQVGSRVIKPVAPAGPKSPAIPLIILCLGLLFCLTGCASTMYKSGCGHLTGNEVTIPYVGGKANANAYGCYMACVGNCKNQDFTPLQKMTSDYLTVAGKDNSIKTVDGGIVTYTPPLK